MRLLHVHSGNIFGGVERILIALAGHRTVSNQFEHVFALAFHGRLENSLSAAGAPVFSIPPFKFSRPWQLIRTRASLNALLQAHSFDLAVVHSAWSHVAFSRVIGEAGLPLLFWLHSAAGNESFLDRAAQLRFPTRVLSVSAAVDGTAQALFPCVRSDVVHSPLALDERAFASANREETRTALGAGADDVIIVQASRMEAWKGHSILLKALAKLPQAARWQCWIAGGAERPEEIAHLEQLKGLAHELTLEARVKFLGARSDIPALLKAADIYCQANLEGEGFSIAFVEAFYAGLPIVTSAIGGAVEIVNSRNGILLPPGDVNALAKELETLIQNETLRRVLGECGQRRALERCNPARQFQALEKVFLETAASHV